MSSDPNQPLFQGMVLSRFRSTRVHSKDLRKTLNESAAVNSTVTDEDSSANFLNPDIEITQGKILFCKLCNCIYHRAGALALHESTCPGIQRADDIIFSAIKTWLDVIQLPDTDVSLVQRSHKFTIDQIEVQH